MFFKSREQQVHQRVCREIEDRLARTGAPREIRAFLLERWSWLLTGIYVNHGDQDPDWDAGWHTVNALLWSLLPKADLEDTHQLLRLLPTLLERLQDGCDAMQLPTRERDELFGQLAMLHAAVARAGLQADEDEEGPITRLGSDADMGMDDVELASLAVRSGDMPLGRVVRTDHADGLENLRVGDVVAFRQAQGEKRLKVHWISPMGGMYLFTDEQGQNAQSLTLVRLAEKFASGEAWRG